MKLGSHKRLVRHFPTVAVILCLVTIGLIYHHNYRRGPHVLFGDENIPRSEYEQCPGLVNILGKLKECYNGEINAINPNLTLWNTLHLIATHCGTHFLRDYVFNTTFHSNMDDSKAIIYPDDRNAEIHSVTAGIGDDIIVEQQLKADLPNAHFYGADPFAETSRVFGKVGAVAKVGISNRDSVTNSSVLIKKEYVWREIRTVTLPQLLAKFRLSFIDFLFIDIEGAEYDLMPVLLSEEMTPYTICQINVEIHGPMASYGKNNSDFDKLHRRHLGCKWRENGVQTTFHNVGACNCARRSPAACTPSFSLYKLVQTGVLKLGDVQDIREDRYSGRVFIRTK